MDPGDHDVVEDGMKASFCHVESVLGLCTAGMGGGVIKGGDTPWNAEMVRDPPTPTHSATAAPLVAWTLERWQDPCSRLIL